MMKKKNTVAVGVVTVSDRVSRNEYTDISGQAVLDTLATYMAGDWKRHRAVVPDEQKEIEACLVDLVDNKKCCLIITTGGTGPAARDVTPEATAAVCTKMLPGFGEAMRAASRKMVPTAILSRQTAGIRNKTLIINLPGAPQAIKVCLQAIFPAIPDCIDLLNGPYLACNPRTVKVLRRHRKEK